MDIRGDGEMMDSSLYYQYFRRFDVVEIINSTICNEMPDLSSMGSEL